VSLAFLKEGANVIVTYRNDQEFADLNRQCCGLHRERSARMAKTMPTTKLGKALRGQREVTPIELSGPNGQPVQFS
jgi:hypothetical protein